MKRRGNNRKQEWDRMEQDSEDGKRKNRTRKGKNNDAEKGNYRKRRGWDRTRDRIEE